MPGSALPFLIPGRRAVRALLAAAACSSAAASAPCPVSAQSEAPIYVIAGGSGFNQGLGRITRYTGGAAPVFTYLMDFASAPSGQVAIAAGIAWDRATERPVVCSFDGSRESFLAVDLATQTTPFLFEDDLPVQMQGFALGPDGLGYAQHITTTDVLEVDLEALSVRAVGDFGADQGSALAISPEGAVYALDQDTVLRRFDPVTSQTVVIGPTYLWGTAGMDFTADGRLFVLMGGGQLFELDPATGAIDQVSFVSGLELGSGYYALGGMCIALERPAQWQTLCPGNDVAILPVGGARVARNDLRLAGHSFPASVFAMAIVSASSRPPMTSTQFAGSLCLDGSPLRLVDTIQRTTPEGDLNLGVDLLLAPTLGGVSPVIAGDKRFFQVWYRNQAATGATQFTTAIEVTFQ